MKNKYKKTIDKNTESYATGRLKYQRSVIVFMLVTPVIAAGLIFAVFYEQNTRGNTTNAQSNGCNKVISSGSVSAAANTMTSGQVLCLQGSSNFGAGTINRGVKVITIPGQSNRAKVVGYLGLAGNGITFENLYINGNGDIRSPFVTGDNVTLRNNEILNVGATRGICILIGPSDGSIKPRNTVIDQNRIHNCGTVTHDQGIYMAHSIGAKVTNNYIYDNPDFGIQFYPSAQDSLVEYNIFDNNAQGITYSSESGFPIASKNNIVRNNIITNSYRRYNVEYYWGGSVGTGNQFINNCVFNGARGNIQGTVGFSASGTITADPLYVNRSGKDFRLKSNSPCLGKGPQSAQPTSSPAPSPTPIPAPVPTPLPPSSPSPSPSPTPSPPPPVTIPDASPTDPVAIPDEVVKEDDGSIIADFTGDGINDVVKDNNNDGSINPKEEILILGTPESTTQDTTTNQPKAEDTYNPIDQPAVKQGTITIKAGPLPEAKISKPVAYTFLAFQGLAITGLGLYLAITKLAIFAGLKGRLGL